MFITLHCEVNYIFKAEMVNMTYFQPLNHEIVLLFKNLTELYTVNLWVLDC